MHRALHATVSRNTVNTHILNLRRKFRAADPAFDGIRNTYAIGCSFAVVPAGSLGKVRTSTRP